MSIKDILMLSLIHAADMFRTYKTEEMFSLLQYNSERFLVSVKAKKLWSVLKTCFGLVITKGLVAYRSLFLSKVFLRFSRTGLPCFD